MTTKQISVFLENRPGTLAEFCKVLQKNNIDMRAMGVADAMDFGIARVIVDNVYETVTVLKDEGYDLSYIHYTGVAPWYHKLGYNAILKWDRDGILSEETL